MLWLTNTQFLPNISTYYRNTDSSLIEIAIKKGKWKEKGMSAYPTNLLLNTHFKNAKITVRLWGWYPVDQRDGSEQEITRIVLTQLGWILLRTLNILTYTFSMFGWHKALKRLRCITLPLKIITIFDGWKNKKITEFIKNTHFQMLSIIIA